LVPASEETQSIFVL